MLSISIGILLMPWPIVFPNRWNQWRIFVYLVDCCCDINYIVSFTLIKIIIHWKTFFITANYPTLSRRRINRLGFFFIYGCLCFEPLVRIRAQQILWSPLKRMILWVNLWSIALNRSLISCRETCKRLFNNHWIDIGVQSLPLSILIFALFSPVCGITDLKQVLIIPSNLFPTIY